ncbi:ribosomal protein S18-alanine N-acetyltransferase [Christensenellaceae bacterium OttesenSCG-928-K19]|nr:ribosomal protein S18-alanine N-acetyltransferase [Christensenellaceae bacterium OttesenSCG-928-K19]
MKENEEQLMIRPATMDDLESIFECETASFAEPWSYAMLYDDIIENGNTVYLVVLLNGDIIGYGGMWIVLDEAHITNVCIKPEYRKKGYARQLMKELISMSKKNGATSMTLEVRVTNKPALRLYKQCGFTIQGLRKRYYKNNEDAYVMWTERDTLTV